MEKTSPVTRWPGKIVLPDYMNFPTLARWQRAIDGAQKHQEEKDVVAFYDALLPTALGIVKEWHIVGLPQNVGMDDFPASVELVAFVIDCISELYTETNRTDPKSPEQS